MNTAGSLGPCANSHEVRCFSFPSGGMPMLCSKLRICALAGFIVASGAVSAADPVPTTRTAGNHFRAKQILGSKITIQGSTEVGVVDDLVFDDAGNFEYMIVNNGGKLVTVPWEAAKFDVEKK